MVDIFSTAKFFEKSGTVFPFGKGDIEGKNAKLNELNKLSKANFKKTSNKADKIAKDNFSI